MAIVANRAYNDPALGATFTNIASMFAPPSAGDMAGYSAAALNRQKRDQLEQLFGAGANPSEQASLVGIQDYGQTPVGFNYKVDQDNSTSRANNLQSNQFGLLGQRLATPMNPGQMMPELPSSVAGQFGMPALPAVQGNEKPLSETEVKGGWLQDLLDSGKLTQEDVATQYRSGTNVEEVMGADGKTPMYVSRDAAIGMTPAPSSPTTNVTVGAGEKAWDVESAKLFAKQYSDLNAKAGIAQDMLGLLDAAQGALASGVYTGIGGEQLLDLQRLGSALGVDNADAVAGGELVQAIQNRMSLLMRNPESGMGMPGAVSDRDIQFLKAAQPGLARSPEGNRKLLGLLAAMERRKIEVAQLADAYVQENGRLDAGFNQEVRAYAKSNPLFPDPASASEGAPSVDATGEVFAVNPETGERVVYRDGTWQKTE